MQNDIVALGRIVGMLILVVGVALTIWDVADLGEFGAEQQFRVFLRGVLSWAASATLVILAAEIADRLGVVKTR